MLLKNFRIKFDGTGTTSVAGRINYLRTMLHWEALREFDELASQNSGTKNAHLNHIMECLLGYFLLIVSLSNQKCPMHHAMSEP